jgi:hypothetical protein
VRHPGLYNDDTEIAIGLRSLRGSLPLNVHSQLWTSPGYRSNAFIKQNQVLSNHDHSWIGSPSRDDTDLIDKQPICPLHPYITTATETQIIKDTKKQQSQRASHSESFPPTSETETIYCLTNAFCENKSLLSKAQIFNRHLFSLWHSPLSVGKATAPFSRTFSSIWLPFPLTTWLIAFDAASMSRRAHFTTFPMMPLPSNYWLGWVGIKRDYTAGIDSTGSPGVLFWQGSILHVCLPRRQRIIILVFSRWKTAQPRGHCAERIKTEISHFINRCVHSVVLTVIIWRHF